MKTPHTFESLKTLMQAAEDRRNHGLTLILFDDLSGEIVNYCEEGEIKIFAFDSISTLFDGLYHLSLPPSQLN